MEIGQYIYSYARETLDKFPHSAVPQVWSSEVNMMKRGFLLAYIIYYFAWKVWLEAHKDLYVL